MEKLQAAIFHKEKSTEKGNILMSLKGFIPNFAPDGAKNVLLTEHQREELRLEEERSRKEKEQLRKEREDFDRLPEPTKFFYSIYGKEPPKGQIVLWTLQDKMSHSFPSNQIKLAGLKALDLSKQEKDVYFHVGLQKAAPPAGKRGSAENILALTCLYADIDVAGPGHKGDHYPQSQEEALDFIYGLEFGPNIIVDSGGGLHCYWIFSEPWILDSKAEKDRAARLSRALNQWIFREGQKRGWRFDNVSDLARVLRVPGTCNRKGDPVEVKVLENCSNPDEGPYGIEFLEDDVLKDELARMSVPGNMAKVTQPKPGDSIPEGSRNTSLTSYAGSLRRHGAKEEEIAAALHEKNAVSCTPPLPVDEVQAIARSIAQKPSGKPTFPLTDLGNAERLVAAHGESIRYCPLWSKWLIWDGRRWVTDETGQIFLLAKQTVRSIDSEVLRTEDDSLRSQMRRFATLSESIGRLEAMVSLTKTEPGVPVVPDDLDQAPWLLNCLNGTLDLRTGKLGPHRPEDLITKVVPINYDPLAKCPLWLSFLDRVMAGSANLISFLQRSIGYALTGDISEQVVFILHGSGANGKSLFLETIRALLGEYAQQTDFTTFLERKGDTIRNDLAALKGGRFVTASEMPAGRRLDETVAKQISGGEPIKARFLHKEFFEFLPTFKVFLATNHKPHINGADNGIWRRIRLIPFNVTIPSDQQDRRLLEKLKRELPGILAWAVRGCLDWQKNGLGVPAEVKEATASYREEMDRTLEFLESCCELQEGVKTSKIAVYQRYVTWCQETGEAPLQRNTFGAKLFEKNFKDCKSGSIRYWLGIRLKGDQPEEQQIDQITDW